MVTDVGEYVLIVTGDIVGQEAEGIEPFTGEVVYGTDEGLAFTVFPGGVSGFPVGEVSRPSLYQIILLAIVVKVTVKNRRRKAGFQVRRCRI